MRGCWCQLRIVAEIDSPYSRPKKVSLVSNGQYLPSNMLSITSAAHYYVFLTSHPPPNHPPHLHRFFLLLLPPLLLYYDVVVMQFDSDEGRLCPFRFQDFRLKNSLREPLKKVVRVSSSACSSTSILFFNSFLLTSSLHLMVLTTSISSSSISPRLQTLHHESRTISRWLQDAIEWMKEVVSTIIIVSSIVILLDTSACYIFSYLLLLLLHAALL